MLNPMKTKNHEIPLKTVIFPMKNGDFPIKHTREICCMVIFPIKNGDFSHEMSICSPVFCVELSTEPTNSFRRSSWQ